ncbi:MAG: VWA domain-containing protein [Pseudomonadota bacterium]
MIEFLWPWAGAFVLLPLLTYFLLPRARRQDAALYVPFYGMVAGYTSQIRQEQRSNIRRALLVIGWLALVLACMRPQYVGDPIELPTTGRDLMLAVDISGSMGTEDMVQGGRKATRLDVVKAVVGDFVERRKGDRLGLILFGTQAYLQTPLTFDRITVRTLLTETPLGIAGGKTAVGDAIGLAVKRLQTRPADSRVLILLTDGRNNVGAVSPLQAAQIAAQQGVKIYTIGFGSDEMQVPGLLFNRTINPSAELDERTLTEIARLTGGIYQRARDASELEGIYQKLDELEPIEQAAETYRPTRALFVWPLAFAMLLSLFSALFHPLVTSWLAGLVARPRHTPDSEAVDPLAVAGRQA